MKLGVLVALAGLAGIVGVANAAASDHGAAAHTASACTPKIVTIKGHPAVTGCGPAVATVKIAGKTYEFKDGTCQKDSAANNLLTLNLGTLVAGVTSNDGKPYFSLTFVTEGSLKIDTVTVDYGGKKVLSVDEISVKDSNPSKGTFASTKSVLSSSTHFTGTWNCNGPVTAIQ
jgi:hypothetical protein